MFAYAFISLINFFIALSISVFLLLKNIKHDLQRRLAYTNIAIAVWSFSYWQWQISHHYSDALFWTRILTIGSVFIASTFLLWTLTFVNEIKRFRFILVLCYITTALFTIFSATPLMVETVEKTFSFPFWPKPGLLYNIFLPIHFIGFMLFGFIRLWSNLLHSTGTDRQRLLIVIVGMGVGFLGGLTNFPLWYNVPIYPWGNFFIIIYPITLLYAIVRYRFLDIRVALHTVTIKILKITILLLLFIIFVFLYSSIFKQEIYFTGYLLFALLAATVITFTDELIDSVLQRLSGKIFFEKGISTFDIYRKTTELVATSFSLDRIYAVINDFVQTVMQTSYVTFLFSDTKKINHSSVTMKGFQNFDSTVNLDLLLQYINQKPSFFILEEVKRRQFLEKTLVKDNMLKLIMQEMEKMQAEVLIPLPEKNGSFNVLVLGKKNSGNAYNIQDINMLDSLRFQLTTTLENILLYEKEKQFSSRLKGEVEKATSKLRSAYEQLKTIDKMKDYIIDISSHELRTPATIIKSYLWLVLNGKKGRITKIQSSALDRAYQANERLIQLISDMLDVSKIEAKRLELNIASFDIFDLIQKVAEDLQFKVKEEKIFLKIEKPHNTDYQISADREKTEEVFTNLLTNAIKYTKQGGVTVSIEEDKFYIIVHVKDTGVGIQPEDLPKLFTKFYRTEQALVEIPTAGGTGLGLFITKSLIQMMGGTIWVESKVNEGSVFSFKLPKKIDTNSKKEVLGENA